MSVAPLEPTAPASYREVLRLPRHLVGEILDGELHVAPRPRTLHAFAALRIGSLVDGAFGLGRGGPGGWVILPEPELHLVPREPVVPDLAGWRVERAPDLATALVATTPPDWVCEILSPSTRVYDRLRKLPYYARHGVEWCWLVDLEGRSVEVFRRAGDNYLAVGGAEDPGELALAPFEAAALDFGLVFGPKPPPTEDELAERGPEATKAP